MKVIAQVVVSPLFEARVERAWMEHVYGSSVVDFAEDLDYVLTVSSSALVLSTVNCAINDAGFLVAARCIREGYNRGGSIILNHSVRGTWNYN